MLTPETWVLVFPWETDNPPTTTPPTHQGQPDNAPWPNDPPF